MWCYADLTDVGVTGLTGRFKTARSDLERCLELNPSFGDAKLNLEQVKKDLDKQDCHS